jgi:hypothetical protein
MVNSSLLPSWQRMWDTITSKYVNQPLVYLDPINEPIGFTTSQWLNFAANFITRETGEGMPSNRLFIGGRTSTPNHDTLNILRLDGGYDGSSGGKCLEAQNAGTANGIHVVIDNGTGATSQQWLFLSDGTVRNVNSRLCLDADLCADNAGASALIANRAAIGAWEEFDLLA